MNDFIRNIKLLIDGDATFSKLLQSVDCMRQFEIKQCEQTVMTSETVEAILLKISNYLVAKYQYVNRHEYLISKPYSLIIEPSNNCPLHCLGCLHNKVFQKKIGADWPSGLQAKDTFNSFIERFGPYASTILFYNWGEPLLNHHTPFFIRQAKKYLLSTSLSSNLSVNFNAEDLVTSGLDYMILSIDGASWETYGNYRRGGNFELVVGNIQKLVAAKNKYNLSTPRLSWQFLLFEHNKHEVEAVKKMACELGVNEVKFAWPYNVPWESDLQIAKDVKEETFIVPNPGGGVEVIEPQISNSFSKLIKQNWVDKIKDIDESLLTKRSGSTCQWLYSSLVMDACGRYLPCCYAPRKDSGYTWIFANQRGNGSSSATDEAGANPFNSEYYRFSRKHFVWLSELENPGGIAPRLGNGKSVPYCVACPDKHVKPLVNDFHLQRYLRKLDKGGLLTEESIKIIADWGN